MTIARDKFIRRIFARRKQSVWVAILGKKQSGKTDLALFLMESLHRLGLFEYFGTNIKIENPPFPIDHIKDFQTLEQRCRMLNPNPKASGLKRYLFFGSEMGKWLPKDQAWKNVDFIEKLQTVRKYGLSWIGDAISRVDGRALNEHHFEGCFIKLSVTNPTIARYENWVTGQTTFIDNIPRTTLNFDTYETATFTMEPEEDADLSLVPLSEKHQLVKLYLENGYSWKKAGVPTQTGKRAMIELAEYHFSHCLPKLREHITDKTPSEVSDTT